MFYIEGQFLQPHLTAYRSPDQPTLAPFRNVLFAVDWAVVVFALLQSLILFAITIAGDSWLRRAHILLVWGVIGVLGLLINLYFFILIAMIIISWVAPGSRHPAIELIWQVSEPVMAPVRSLLPNMGGIDFSPILLFVIINVVQIGLRHLAVGMGLPPGLVFGL